MAPTPVWEVQSPRAWLRDAKHTNAWAIDKAGELWWCAARGPFLRWNKDTTFPPKQHPHIKAASMSISPSGVVWLITDRGELFVRVQTGMPTLGRRDAPRAVTKQSELVEYEELRGLFNKKWTCADHESIDKRRSKLVLPSSRWKWTIEWKLRTVQEQSSEDGWQYAPKRTGPFGARRDGCTWRRRAYVCERTVVESDTYWYKVDMPVAPDRPDCFLKAQCVSWSPKGSWVLTTDYELFFRAGIDTVDVEGSSWIGPIAAPQVGIDVIGPCGTIACNESGDTWLLALDGRIYCRTGIDDSKPAGTGWKAPSGHHPLFSWITVTESMMYATDQLGRLLYASLQQLHSSGSGSSWHFVPNPHDQPADGSDASQHVSSRYAEPTANDLEELDVSYFLQDGPGSIPGSLASPSRISESSEQSDVDDPRRVHLRLVSTSSDLSNLFCLDVNNRLFARVACSAEIPAGREWKHVDSANMPAIEQIGVSFMPPLTSFRLPTRFTGPWKSSLARQLASRDAAVKQDRFRDYVMLFADAKVTAVLAGQPIDVLAASRGAKVWSAAKIIIDTPSKRLIIQTMVKDVDGGQIVADEDVLALDDLVSLDQALPKAMLASDRFPTTELRRLFSHHHGLAVKYESQTTPLLLMLRTAKTRQTLMLALRRLLPDLNITRRDQDKRRVSDLVSADSEWPRHGLWLVDEDGRVFGCDLAMHGMVQQGEFDRPICCLPNVGHFLATNGSSGLSSTSGSVSLSSSSWRRRKRHSPSPSRLMSLSDSVAGRDRSASNNRDRKDTMSLGVKSAAYLTTQQNVPFEAETLIAFPMPALPVVLPVPDQTVSESDTSVASSARSSTCLTPAHMQVSGNSLGVLWALLQDGTVYCYRRNRQPHIVASSQTSSWSVRSGGQRASTSSVFSGDSDSNTDDVNNSTFRPVPEEDRAGSEEAQETTLSLSRQRSGTSERSDDAVPEESGPSLPAWAFGTWQEVPAVRTPETQRDLEDSESAPSDSDDAMAGLKLQSIGVSRDCVWACTCVGHVVVRAGVSDELPEGTSWHDVSPRQAIHSIKVQHDGTITACDSVGRLLTRVGFSALYPFGTHWATEDGMAVPIKGEFHPMVSEQERQHSPIVSAAGSYGIVAAVCEGNQLVGGLREATGVVEWKASIQSDCREIHSDHLNLVWAVSEDGNLAVRCSNDLSRQPFVLSLAAKHFDAVMRDKQILSLKQRKPLSSTSSDSLSLDASAQRRRLLRTDFCRLNLLKHVKHDDKTSLDPLHVMTMSCSAFYGTHRSERYGQLVLGNGVLVPRPNMEAASVLGARLRKERLRVKSWIYAHLQSIRLRFHYPALHYRAYVFVWQSGDYWLSGRISAEANVAPTNALVEVNEDDDDYQQSIFTCVYTEVPGRPVVQSRVKNAEHIAGWRAIPQQPLYPDAARRGLTVLVQKATLQASRSASQTSDETQSRPEKSMTFQRRSGIAFSADAADLDVYLPATIVRVQDKNQLLLELHDGRGELTSVDLTDVFYLRSNKLIE